MKPEGGVILLYYRPSASDGFVSGEHFMTKNPPPDRTVYARHEPPKDVGFRKAIEMSQGAPKKDARLDPRATKNLDVQVYADQSAQTPMERFPARYTSKPKPRSKYVTINGVKYNLVWIDDVLPCGNTGENGESRGDPI